MSDAAAIGAVTAALQNLLRRALTGYLEQGFEVLARAPARVVPANGAEPGALNLFLYHVAPNPGWRSADLPAYSGAGQRVASPPLVLDLHYLLAAYGGPDLLPDLLLGRAMQALHETPILSRDALEALLPPPLPNDPDPGFKKYLAESGLAGQPELIKISQEPLDLDGWNKLWTACQAAARPAAAYKVTTVIIEGGRPPRSALPVKAAALVTVPLDRPRIDLVRADPPGAPIASGATVVIEGAGLAAPGQSVRIGALDATGLVQPGGSDARLELVLPQPLPADWRAGMLGLRILRPAGPGAPAWAARESNLAALVLQPRAIFSVPQSEAMADEPGLRQGRIAVDLDPPVQRDQQLRLLLDQTPPPASHPARGYSLAWAPPPAAPAPPAPIASVEFPFARIVPGSYLARISVDGAESPLVHDGTRYTAPEVTL